ncbi:MAG: hypothetical protein PHP98_02625 [Kiritimatiellae bacterium]|nr:hypothetical protein [Kiritimatiellia bacterium]
MKKYTMFKQVYNLIPGHLVNELAKKSGVEERSRTFLPWMESLREHLKQSATIVKMGMVIFSLWMTLFSAGAELISEWKFDGDLKDNVGKNHGKFIGNGTEPAWAPDRLHNDSKALSLAGGYVDCGNDGGLSFGDGKKDHAFTIEAWVKMNERSGFVIASKKGEYLLINNNHLRLYLYDGNTGKSIHKSGGDLLMYEKEWIHLATVYDGSGGVDGIKHYVNGQPAHASGQSEEKGYIAMQAKNGSFCIGGPAGQDKNINTITQGMMDEVRVYCRALTAEEVSERYNQVLEFQAEVFQKSLELIDMYNDLRRLPFLRLAEKFCAELELTGKKLTDDLPGFREKIKSGDKSGKVFFSYPEFKAAERITNANRRLEKILARIEDGRVKEGDLYLSYVVDDPMSEDVRGILPFLTALIPGEISDEIKIAACAGEYEPASFVVTALADLNSLQVTAGDLKMRETPAGRFDWFRRIFKTKSQAGDIIPSSAIDVKLVKCWYQSGNAGEGIDQDKTKRMLIPELLLNDDLLVKVDHEKRGNYLRLSFPEGEKYIWASDPAWDEEIARKTRPRYQTVDRLPIKDAPVLQPVNIPAGRNQQFWITVKAPEDAKPGVYEGKISLSTPGKELRPVSLKLRVLPFKLSKPYYTFSIDYHGTLSEVGTISSRFKSRQQFKKDLENMVAHGLDNCQHYGVKKEMLGETLEIRRAAGMDNKTLYLKHTIPVGNPTETEKLEAIKKNVRDIIEFVRPYGVKTVYFYGMCEVQGDKLKSQRLVWEAVRTAGGKIFVAGGGDNVKMMADIQDLHVRAGALSAKEAAEWHSYGHKIFSYANPQCGVENPEIYRRNFGLLLWKNDYDGAADNAYQHSFGFTWNDFDHPQYRSHSMTYPAMDGPVNTIQYEGYREAADDVRYVTTLQEMIAPAEKSGSAGAKESARAANEYLKKLKESEQIDRGNLNVIRREIIAHILNLYKELEN